MDNHDLEQRIAWLEANLRRVAGSASPPVPLTEHPFADPGEVSDEVRQLVAEGQTMRALQLHREQTGAGLADAKDTIEALVAGA